MKYRLHTLLIIVVFFSCAKENSQTFTPDVNNQLNDTVWTSTISSDAPVYQIASLLKSPPETKDLSVADGGILEFYDSVQIIFPPNACKGAVADIVHVEVDYLKSKGDMVRFLRPTMSDGRLLESGGAFNIRVLQNGKALEMADLAYIAIKYKTKTTDPGMQLFYGDTTTFSTGNFNWELADTSAISTFIEQDTAGISVGYEILSNKFDWINCDKFIDTGTLTTLYCTLPVNFTNKNTAVFIVFNDMLSVMTLNSDAEKHFFYSAKIPMGKTVQLISISNIGEDLYLGIKEVIITANSIETLSPQKKTSGEIKTYLDTLQ